MFQKILIANRGEIAVRIARTAKQLGIACVAVYSEADADALHVAVCDEAYCIGGAAASESYLRGDKILDVAKICGAEAIHPGYGFLSESAGFANDCESAGIVFIGPPVAAIEAMGSKSEAKRIMQAANVPLLSGYHGDDQSDTCLSLESKKIGYPQLIKASAGGGGKGMRVVNQADEFEAALNSARREASASFGDDKVLIERYLSGPRHVEMQVFADQQGNVVHLFDRDCSIQRRHQKILEEAPAPGISNAVRTKMAQTAINCAKAVGYVGAGTVEFLLDSDGRFYFMEMNTRLQVEHPVTEMITGLDLVHWQLLVASGKPLPLKQSQIRQTGHAIEARLYAEVPERDFMPASGQIRHLLQPKTNASVRLDTAVRAGDNIGIHYDPMIAKLIVHGHDRAQALSKLSAALRGYQILGVQTNIGLLASILSVDAFAAGVFDTGFIETHRASLFSSPEESTHIAACAAALALLPALKNGNHSNADPDPDPSQSGLGQSDPWQNKSGWRMNQQPHYRVKLCHDDDVYNIEITPYEDNWRVSVNNKTFNVKAKWQSEQSLRLEINASLVSIPVLTDTDGILLWHNHRQWRFTRFEPLLAFDDEGGLDGQYWDGQYRNEYHAPMPGTIISIPVSLGDVVEADQILLIIEAMKMEHSIVASRQSTVTHLFYEEGDQVEEGDQLVTLAAVDHQLLEPK